MGQFLIGCDPEIFVREKKTGKLVTAHGLVKGTKDEPFKVDSGAYQVDGMALEFNTDPVPAEDFEAFNTNIISVMKQLKAAVPNHSFVIEPSVQFDPEYYDKEVPKDAKELGCDPDFNAYTGGKNPRPDGDSGLRSAAGHIHIGWGSDIPVDNEKHIEICRAFVQNLDCFVGLGMMFLDADARRRELYGKAGAFRVKSYGVEYRTPSNVWLRNKASRMMIHRLVNAAIEDMKRKQSRYQWCANRYENLSGDPAQEDFNIERIINEGDIEAAIRLEQNYNWLRLPPQMIEAGRALYVIDETKKAA